MARPGAPAPGGKVSSPGRRAPPRAAIFGLGGLRLLEREETFFRAADPLGFILFARNCDTPEQVRDLVSALRACVGRADAPVLIDQEGGRVQRLKPPHWRAAPAAARIAALAGRSENDALEAAWLNARLLAKELTALGIDADCLPLLDVPAPGAHAIIGDRALGDAPDRVAMLGRAVCEGLLSGGVLPVVKHIPGHGRAGVDSHRALPIVEASRAELERVDFAPFRALNGMPWAMTAHVVYTALDPDAPATTSKKVVGDVIRGWIGFDGLLISDDLCMGALAGTPARRAAAALGAGVDIALHCNGVLAEMEAVAEVCPRLGDAALARVARGESLRLAHRAAALDVAEADARLASLLEGVSV